MLSRMMFVSSSVPETVSGGINGGKVDGPAINAAPGAAKSVWTTLGRATKSNAVLGPKVTWIAPPISLPRRLNAGCGDWIAMAFAASTSGTGPAAGGAHGTPPQVEPELAKPL